MRLARTFVVQMQLPTPVAPLKDVALDLRWIWNRDAQELFRRIDPKAWDFGRRDPVGILAQAGPGRFEQLAADTAFTDLLARVVSELQATATQPRWFHERGGSLRSVAYFSPEFGLAEAIPQYSGGLGVLAGDHLKAADDLGLPLMGVGLLYHHGYFRQELDAGGWQREHYPTLDPHGMALSPIPDLLVEVDLAGRPLIARVWRAQVGNVPLYLLDANLEENDADARVVTDRLYGGGREHRIRQEILLGIGGVRALDGLDADVQLFHTNEGHAGFLALERIRMHVARDGLTFEEAVEAVRGGTIFTTHTSVPAGIDRFDRELMERYFSAWAEEVGISFGEFMELGREPGDDEGAVFNMAAMGFKLAGLSNGVSLLHGGVSRRLFSGLWPGIEPDDVPITSITNGVHARTWVGAEMDDLLTRYVHPDWPGAEPENWAGVHDVPDEELWRARDVARHRLVEFIRKRVRESSIAKGLSPWDLAWVDDLLDPGVLTIGFARRFAGYKRATLLLSHPERLRSLLLSEDTGVQIVFAGKAHPADDGGKEMIRQIVEFARDPDIRRRLVFVEDYDIGLARILVQGCDVWLNTPRRPQEASGTSGMKAALNGGLNCSVLDGWWDEMFDGNNGWAVPSAEGYEDEARRDEVEAAALLRLLGDRVARSFYDRAEDGIPRGWTTRIKASLRSLGPQVTASRMLRDYTHRLYEPSAVRHEALADGVYAGARELAAWKQRVRSGWDKVRFEVVSDDGGVGVLGAKRTVTCTVALGDLVPEDVEVQLTHGPLDAEDELLPVATVAMERVDVAEETGMFRYRVSFALERAGRYGYAIRVVPAHRDLPLYAEMALAVWA